MREGNNSDMHKITLHSHSWNRRSVACLCGWESTKVRYQRGMLLGQAQLDALRNWANRHLDEHKVSSGGR